MKRRVKLHGHFWPEGNTLINLGSTKPLLEDVRCGPFFVASVTIEYDDGKRPAKKKAKR